MTSLEAPLAIASVLAVDEDRVAPGLIGFLVVAALGVATWLLIKSMNKQIRKIDFDESETARHEDGTDHEVPSDQQ